MRVKFSSPSGCIWLGLITSTKKKTKTTYKLFLGACSTELSIVTMTIYAQTSPPLQDFSREEMKKCLFTPDNTSLTN